MIGVGVRELEMDGLLVVGRGIAVIHEGEVDGDSIAEAGELQVPVVPPTRVLLAEYEHQHYRDDEDTDTARGIARAGGPGAAREGAAFQKPSEDRDRDDREDTKSRAEPVEAAVGIV